MGTDSRYRFFEFFCGAGMARLGLGPHWQCVFANDNDPAKYAAYVENFGAQDIHLGDIAKVEPRQLDGEADLAWASFPCQDLSLAGARAGLNGHRSGVFYDFWSLISRLKGEGRAPGLIVIENVLGLLTSKGGADFASLCRTLLRGGYSFGALEIDARWFLPQSRSRLFVVAVRNDLTLPAELVLESAPDLRSPFHSRNLQRAVADLPATLRKAFVWWAVPCPPRPNQTLAQYLDPDEHVAWHSPEETARLVGLMSETGRKALQVVRQSGEPRVGAFYRRMRTEKGRKVQRVEVRFDGLAGCLRTPAGGSSRQFILSVKGDQTRSRAMSAREYARLMGLSDGYKLPERERAALHLAGDGVVVDVVAFLRQHLLEPVLDETRACAMAAE